MQRKPIKRKPKTKRLKPTAKKLNADLDKAWSLVVKMRAGFRCEYCGTREKVLNSHHIYSRSNYSTRWDVENGICLCVGHHTFSNTFSAHKTPTEFTQWLYETKGEVFMNELRVRAHAIAKLREIEKTELMEQLRAEIKKHDELHHAAQMLKKS